jgi:hypothetical protein
MGLLRWLRSKRINAGDSRRDQWRRAWRAACVTPDAAGVTALSSDLNRLGLPEEEIEIEREMLAGLDQLVQLQSAVATNGLPVIETGHRVVGVEACHFSAPSSMPDDSAQPSGRLIFTNARAIFAGGARATTVPWHAVAEVLQQGRDVILVRRDRESLHRFRCNLFADALCAGFLARTLASRKRGV